MDFLVWFFKDRQGLVFRPLFSGICIRVLGLCAFSRLKFAPCRKVFLFGFFLGFLNLRFFKFWKVLLCFLFGQSFFQLPPCGCLALFTPIAALRGVEKGYDQAERVISAPGLNVLLRLYPEVYRRGGLPRPFGENSSWEGLGA